MQKFSYADYDTMCMNSGSHKQQLGKRNRYLLQKLQWKNFASAVIVGIFNRNERSPRLVGIIFGTNGALQLVQIERSITPIEQSSRVHMGYLQTLK